MNLLTLKGISKAYTDKILFDNVDFGIESGEKVGIIGINGTGKTTLLKIIAGIEETDSGEYTKGSNIVINYLPQNPDFKEGISIYDYVISVNHDLSLKDTLEGDAKTILNHLGFDDYSLKLDNLSGGQRKKVALAGALLSKNEILILDEPTNHLDNEMTEWLQEWLASYKGAVIMVTHDRYFLDLVCNRIVEIDKGKLYSYKANYEGFLSLKAEREAMANATYAKHQNILRKEIAWIQRGARARTTKQKAHIQRYEALRDEEAVKFDQTAEISSVSTRMGKKTIELHKISKSFNSRTLISDFEYIFLKDDRVGILGPNGCGKTTLLKLITGNLTPDSGTIEIGETIKIGYYAQECSSMNESQRVIDYIKDTAELVKTDDGYITASQMLENFLFEGSMQYQPIGKLSGGERRRLYLAKVLMEAPNVLILDEPTNDLDISTLCVLEDFLDTFQGIVIVVSHDRYFLDRIAKKLLTFEGNGQIRLYNGTYTEYFLEKKDNLVVEASNSDHIDGKLAYKLQKEASKKLKFTYNEQKEYETIEDDIAKLEDKIKELTHALSDGKISSDFVKLAQLTAQKEETEKLLDDKLERYMYLDDLAQRIKSSGT